MKDLNTLQKEYNEIKRLMEERNADKSQIEQLEDVKKMITQFCLHEQEKFDEANKLIQEMDHLLPTFRYSAAKGVDKTTHEDRAEYLDLKGLNYAYRNEQAKAERYFQDLVAKAPNNIGYQNNLATVQRWREKEWPLTSARWRSRW